MTSDGSPDGITDVATIDETETEEGATDGKKLPTFYEGESRRTAFQLCCIENVF